MNKRKKKSPQINLVITEKVSLKSAKEILAATEKIVKKNRGKNEKR